MNVQRKCHFLQNCAWLNHPRTTAKLTSWLTPCTKTQSTKTFSKLYTQSTSNKEKEQHVSSISSFKTCYKKMRPLRMPIKAICLQKYFISCAKSPKITSRSLKKESERSTQSPTTLTSFMPNNWKNLIVLPKFQALILKSMLSTHKVSCPTRSNKLICNIWNRT